MTRDNHRYAVGVALDAASPLERKAAELLADRAAERLGAPVAVVDEAVGAADGQVLVAVVGTPETSASVRAAVDAGEVVASPSAVRSEAYSISARDGGGPVVIAASEPGALVFGVGALLRASRFAGGEWHVPPMSVTTSPEKHIRPIYFATHFGNWYVHADDDELRRYIEDLALAGYNELVTWFDLHHYRSFEDGAETWERLTKLDGMARAVGMRIGRIAIANESFEGQAPEHLRAVGRLEGTGYVTDLCPSKPEARAIILEDRRAFLERVRETTTVDWVCLWPYDQGGCNCEDCTPWPATYMELCREIAGLTTEILPDTKVVVSAWWIGTHVPGEDESFFECLSRGERWFDTVMAGTVELRRWLAGGRKVPSQYDVLLFPEISMFDGTPWGGRGANPAPRKFAAEMAELGPYIGGAMPYSEGRYEDINKFVWARLQWDPTEDVSAIVEEYCRHAFGADVAADAARLVEAVEPGLFDLAGASDRHARLLALEPRLEPWAREGWRWETLRARTALDALRVEAQSPDTDEARRGEAREEMRRVYEDMQSRLHRHDPEKSLHFWIYLPFEEWLDVPLHQYVLPTGSSS